MDAPEARLPRIAVTPDEAAIVTGRTRTRIFEALKNGEIAGRKDGKAVVIEISELERWVRSFPTRGRQAMPPQRSCDIHDRPFAKALPCKCRIAKHRLR
jgi:hypothetical protein